MIAWKNISIIDYKMLYSIQNTYHIYSGKMYNWELIIYSFISISVVGAKPQIYYN